LAAGSEVWRGSIERDRADTAFARLYADHVWRVYGFLAYRLGGDRETTEDLTQLTFERALRAWPRFDPRRASESTWLLSIASNALIDHYRRGARVFEELDDRALPRVSGPEERFAGSPELVSALAQLAEREREVLALRYGGDLSGPEIAELLGLSVANVQQISSRALRRLRELLEKPQRLDSQ
jgi:RNA polymerase sigma-70 factor, ECF subfamily